MIGINLQEKSGYSLIEVMTGVTIFAILTLASVNLFLNTTIGSTKDNSIRKVKQNGDHISSLLSNSLRSAKTIEPNSQACTENMDSISITKTNDPTVENWYVQDGMFYLNGEPLLDESIVVADDSVVPGGGLDIDCQYDQGAKTTFIDITFTLQKGTNPTGDNQNYILQEFKTSVSVRNKL